MICNAWGQQSWGAGIWGDWCAEPTYYPPHLQTFVLSVYPRRTITIPIRTSWKPA